MVIFIEYIEYECNGNRNKNLSLKKYLNEIKAYLKDIITISENLAHQLKIEINFLSSKNINEEQVMHTKSDKKEVMTYDNANEVNKEISELLLSRYQTGLKYE